jgi:hypothetical protein
MKTARDFLIEIMSFSRIGGNPASYTWRSHDQISTQRPIILSFFVAYLSVSTQIQEECLKIKPRPLPSTSFPIQYSVIILTGDWLRAGRPRNRGSISGRDKIYFCSRQHSDGLWGHPAPIQWVLPSLSLRERMGRVEYEGPYIHSRMSSWSTA